MLNLKILIATLPKPNVKHLKTVTTRTLQISAVRFAQNRRHYSNENEFKGKINNFGLVAGVGIAGFGLWYLHTSKTHISALEKNKQTKKVATEDIGKFIDGLPVYNMDDVRKHNDGQKGIWISYKNGVYDITSFVDKHPGGDKILMAAGGSVEPFWSLYAVHQQPGILSMMEGYRIGNLAKGEEKIALANMDDPYANEPMRHPVLQIRSAKPFNAEPPANLLVENFITPNEVFYVRNHLPVPDIDESDYHLEVVQKDGNTLNLKLEDLKKKYPKYKVTAALQCAGNRRSEMNEVKVVKGLEWSQSAIGNAEWAGPRLRDILLEAGFQEGENIENLHIQFEGADTDPANMAYGASIPLSKALDPRGDVILAYEMNGEPLNRDHGYPVRVIIPGTVGARWVKWLSRIEISEKESESHWQQNDYKSFSPSVDWHNVDFSKAPAIQELPVNCAVCDPLSGEKVRLKNGSLKLRGYAWSGGGRGIIRVDVTTDQGKNWQIATLLDSKDSRPNRQWGWTRWTIDVPVESKGPVEVWVRAVDSSYNTQPENMEHVWNLRGLMANAYHKVKINVQD